VLDYDHSSGAVDTRSVEAMLRAAKEAGYTIEFVLETHAHADHLSGAPVIKAMTGAKVGIGEHIKDVQRIFRPIFNATDLKTDGGDFDRLFRDGERFKIGELDLEVLYTPADVSYMIEDAMFFGGDAHKLYRSIKRLLALPPPRLLLPSIQVNIRAGKFPPAEANGVHYLAIPVTLKGGAEACV
jgi:glyoxylase-like metal-dependent hydrolase (beta-lactamase superfamily II)